MTEIVAGALVVASWAMAMLFVDQDIDRVATQFGAGRPERWRSKEFIFLVPTLVTILVVGMSWLARSIASARLGTSLSEADRSAAVRNLNVLQIFVAVLGVVSTWEQGRTAMGHSSHVNVLVYLIIAALIGWLVLLVIRERQKSRS